MKNKNILLAAFVGLVSLFLTTPTFAQTDSTSSNFSVGADIYSNYIWRGSKFGSGPAFQPTVKFVAGGLTIGAWGSFDAAGYTEADLYASYALPFGLTLGLTDYYYPTWDGVQLKYFDYSDTSGTHGFEVNVGYTLGGLTLSANYMLNKAPGAGTVGGDKYFQIGYNFSQFNIFVGAGDGWHTLEENGDSEFQVCNIGLGTSKTIKLSDTFSVPVTGQVILNPHKEQLYLVVGFSL